MPSPIPKPKPENFREQIEKAVKDGLPYDDIALAIHVCNKTFQRWLNEEFPGMSMAQIRKSLGGEMFKHASDRRGMYLKKEKPALRDQLPPIEDFERPRLAVPVRIMTEEELKQM